MAYTADSLAERTSQRTTRERNCEVPLLALSLLLRTAPILPRRVHCPKARRVA